MRRDLEFNAFAVVTQKGSIVRHIEGYSVAPMLFRSKWEASRTAQAVGMGCSVVKVEVKIKRRLR